MIIRVDYPFKDAIVLYIAALVIMTQIISPFLQIITILYNYSTSYEGWYRHEIAGTLLATR